MSMMSELFADGWIVDLVIAFVLAEAVALTVYWLWKKRGVAPADFLPGMASGALMLLALRVVLAGSGWIMPTLCLTAAGAAHLIDISRRWRS